MTARPSAFRGIRHVAFRVTNLEECEAFYKDVMGMELLYRANENLVSNLRQRQSVARPRR